MKYITVKFWSGLLVSTGSVLKFLCTPFLCGRQVEVQPMPDVRVVSVVDS